MLSCMIVDDSHDARKIASRAARALGLNCIEVANGREACDMCESLMPDVLIVDWHMPVMSGMEFLARLRAMNGGTRPKVLFCTTKAGIDFIREALAAGADEYIVKPFDKATLAGKLVQLDVLGKPKT